jgi:hypothetical protein
MTPHPADIPGLPPKEPTFADIAVELELCALEFPELSYVMLLESNLRGLRVANLELLAARVGIDTEVARRIIADARQRVNLIGAAHLTFKALIPYESLLRPLLATDVDWAARFGRTA